MSLRSRRGCKALVLLLGVQALPARAQLEPAPPLRGARRWVFDWTLRPIFTNSLFLGSTGEDVSFAARAELALAATASLRHARSRGLLSYAARGWASESFYVRDTRLSRPVFGLGAAAERRLSRAARVNANTSFSSGLNLESLDFSQGALFDLDMKSFSGETSLIYQLGPRTTATTTLNSIAFRYRSDSSFDSGKLPADAQVPPDIRQPLAPVPDPGAPVLPVPDPASQVLGYLGPEGLRTPRLDYWTWRLGTELSQQLSARTRVAVGVGYRGSETTPFASSEGDQVDAQLQAQRALHPSASIAASYSVQASRYARRDVNHTLQLRGQQSPHRWLTVDGSIGASYLDGLDRVSSTLALLGGAGFSLRLKGAAMAARYERSRYQGLVTGRHYTTDSAFASLSRPLMRRITVSGYGYMLASQDSIDASVSYRQFLVGASSRARVRKRFIVGASAAYYRFDRNGLPASARPVFSFYLTRR